MIYDCFPLLNELELLDLRLRVLAPVVDKFVLVESTTTFTGQPKELFYNDNKSRFADFADKIIHVIVKDSPPPRTNRDCWNVEEFQRTAIMRGLTDAAPDDRIIVSDADEIAHPDEITRLSTCDQMVGFPLRLYYYYVNLLQNQIWKGPVMCRRADMLEPHAMRFHRSLCPVYAEKLGWHFSFLGGVQAIRDKLAAFSEQQVNTAAINNPDHIERCLEIGKDLFFRPDTYAHKRWVPIDETYPACIHEWLATYPNMVRADRAKS